MCDGKECDGPTDPTALGRPMKASEQTQKSREQAAVESLKDCYINARTGVIRIAWNEHDITMDARGWIAAARRLAQVAAQAWDAGERYGHVPREAPMQEWFAAAMAARNACIKELSGNADVAQFGRLSAEEEVKFQRQRFEEFGAHAAELAAENLRLRAKLEEIIQTINK